MDVARCFYLLAYCAFSLNFLVIVCYNLNDYYNDINLLLSELEMCLYQCVLK